ncbi:acetyl esterase/lipase [Tamilnaduibacter salinus]|uniref:Acetyl esterase/lipase n=1 Tax=Tamilnaduibacter salinus TaxID=1484056 RepID=A0A2U1CVP5_9GAMM|nr:alpha/beta hydrolase [Tamilnaduibacter salinus]PVY75807.1 acetyl esterase/lipase [Tamilnaduibacter salinus]
MSIQARLVKAFSRRALRREGLAGDRLVRHLRRAFNNTPVIRLIPRGIETERIDTLAFRGDYLGHSDPKVTVLFFHGGAYIAGETRTYHNLAGRLAKQLQGEVYLPTYPFAPEHPFPAAVNRCLEAYKYLLDQGKDPANIVIGGDSAGGGLSLATLLHARDKGLPMPRCGVLLSPGTNCFPNEELLKRNDPTDDMLSADTIRNVIEVYVPNPDDRSHPYASPGTADHTGLPPLMITACNEEVLYGDALDAKASAEKAGVPVEWLERSGLFHVWPIFVPFVPEANQDLKRIVQYIRRQR